MTDRDYTDQKQVERWLEEQAADDATRDRVVVFAARCALRVVPVLGRLDVSDAEARSAIILPVFRATAVPWFGMTNPNHGTGLRAAAADAAADAAARAAYAADARAADAAARVAYAAADAAAAAAVRAAAYAADAADAIARAAYAAAARVAYAAADAAARAAAAAADAAAVRAAAFAAAAEDIKLLNDGMSVQDLAFAPLWHGEIPSEMMEIWGQMRSSLKDAGDDWHVWTHWYDVRLHGGPAHPKLSTVANQRIELARLTGEYDGETIFEEKDWKNPARINGAIRSVIEAERSRARVSTAKALHEHYEDNPSRSKPFIEDDRLGLAFEGSEDDLAAAQSLLQRGRVQATLEKLEHLQTLAESRDLTPAWDRLKSTTSQLKVWLASDAQSLAAQCEIGWERSVTLATMITLNEDLKDEGPGTNDSPLPATVFAALKDANLSVTALVLEFPSCSQIDQLLSREDVAAQLLQIAGILLERMNEANILHRETLDILREAIKSGAFQTNDGRRSAGFGKAGVSKLTLAIYMTLASMGGATFSGTLGEVGAEAARSSHVLTGMGKFAGESVDDVVGLFADAPDNVREAVKFLAEDSREPGGGSVPLPEDRPDR